MTREELQRAARLGVPDAPSQQEPGMVSQAISAVRQVADSPGAAPLWAAWRAGLKDLQDIAGQAFPSEINHSREEAGSIANPTNYLVTEQMKGKELDIDLEP